jgi:hypothetical protein
LRDDLLVLVSIITDSFSIVVSGFPHEFTWL